MRIIDFFAAAAGGYALADTFTRADNASSLGNAESGQTWQGDAGKWGILSNCATPKATGQCTTWADTGIVDVDATFTIQSGAAISSANLLLLHVRMSSDGTDDITIRFSGTIYLNYTVGGTATTLESHKLAWGAGVTKTIRILCVGSRCQVWVNGTLTLDTTSAYIAARTGTYMAMHVYNNPVSGDLIQDVIVDTP